tara:strand:- start:14702 stop:15634 length:933 start_codon:yes stop_codon:yes gene_type:complete
MMKNKTYLVTGAAGFIGAAIAERLIKGGHFVVTIDNLSTGFTSNIPKGVVFIEGDCQDKKTINKLTKYKFDAIFHVAGQSSGEISFDNPVYDLQTNAQSTLLLLELALKTNCFKFIYASTMSIYGDQKNMPVSEKVVLSPKSFYGVGKIASEYYMRIYQEYGINSTALRLFNVYGPGQNLQNLKQGMVSIFIAQAIKSRNVHVKGSKLRFRDFVFIDDVVNAFFLAAERKDFAFKALNISTGVKTSIEHLMLIIKKYLPFEFNIRYDGSTPGDQFGITGDKFEAKKELDWQPKIDLVNGIEKTCNWALNK